MDLGLFESSRLRFWLWLSLPAVVAVAVTAVSWAWMHQERRGLDARQARLDDLPLLEVQVRKTDALLKSVTPAASQAGLITEAVSRRLDQTAKTAGLTIRSVKFGESGAPAAGLVALKVSVQIQGPLRAVVQWLDEIQKPGVLLSISEAELTALSQSSDEMFAGDLTLLVHLRSI